MQELVWKKVGLVIAKLLAPCSIPNWLWAVASLRKTLDAYFQLRPSSLAVVVAELDERPVNRTQKKGAVRWSGWKAQSGVGP